MDDYPFVSDPAGQPTAVLVGPREHPTPPATDGHVPDLPRPADTVLGHFTVIEPLGRGGCGVVVKAFDRKLRREVAIKQIAPELGGMSPARKRFVREARAAAAVRHENVVQIYAVEEAPTPYLVMEYVPGVTLQRHLAEHGPVSAPEVLRVGAQVARGLAAAHEQGLVHRDVKPANILLDRAGDGLRVKLTDFGIDRTADDASLTESGCVVGTPMYMSPEQAQGDPVDARSDLYSLGSVLYEMASGRPPFRAANSLAVVKRVAEDAPRPIREIVPGTPAWLCAVIARLQARRPADRFQSAAEAADVLERCLADLLRDGAVTLPPGMVRRPARRRAGAVLVAAVVGLGAGGVFHAATRPADPPAASATAPAPAAPEPIPFARPEPAPPVEPPLPAVAPDDAAPAADPPPPPATAELCEAVVADLRRLNPEFKGEVVTRVVAGGRAELVVTNADRALKDISPVRRLRTLQKFAARNAGLTDLSPLHGLPLKYLDLLSAAGVRDLAPLRGMPLETLYLAGFEGDDLTPLAGMPLYTLYCGGGGRRLDLAPLRGSRLRYLWVNDTLVDDLSPLEGLPLGTLAIHGTRVRDLAPLRGMSLAHLQMERTLVTDLSPLRDVPLAHLTLDFDPARDAATLRAIPTLTKINGRPAGAFWAALGAE